MLPYIYKFSSILILLGMIRSREHENRFKLLCSAYIRVNSIGCPKKCARFKVRVIVVLLGWRHWNFNICHLSFLRSVVMESYTKEQRVITVKKFYYNICYKIKSCVLIGTLFITVISLLKHS